MTKDLAMKYSWSDLGAGRKKTKVAFKESTAFTLLTGEVFATLLSNL